MDETTEQVTPLDASRLILASGSQPSLAERRLQSERPVRSMSVVVLGVHPKDVLKVGSTDDQQPVQALGAHRPDPPLRVRVRLGRPNRRQQHLPTLRPEHVVEAAGELRVPITQQVPHPAPLLAEHQQQVAGLLGDPGTVGIGGHARQVDPSRLVFDEEQHIQPPPDRVDGEEVARHDPSRLPTQERPPRGGRSSRCRVQPVAAQRRADRGRRYLHAKPQQLTLDPLVAPGRVLAGQADDQLLNSWSNDGRPVWRCG
jgi:hypothetical protein